MGAHSFMSSATTNTYLRKLRRQRFVGTIASLVAIACLIAGFVIFLDNASEAIKKPKIARNEILSLWDAKQYANVSRICDEALDSSPLEPFLLVMKGLSSFYLGLSESESEKRTMNMDTAIFSLRKALVSKDVPLRPEAIYVLGKSYFHKGVDYYGEAIEYLLESLKAGYASYDTWEYLALAAQGSGQLAKSIEYYDMAMSLKPGSPELMIAAALANKANGNVTQAERLAKNALEITTDAYLAERCNFILGEIFSSTRRHTEALAKYNEIIEKNPQSADAWYFLGLLLVDSGEPIKARAAWRKAVSIDPMHSGARLKLSERS
jgi:tetratricopeptide (TPR) repeat protein